MKKSLLVGALALVGVGNAQTTWTQVGNYQVGTADNRAFLVMPESGELGENMLTLASISYSDPLSTHVNCIRYKNLGTDGNYLRVGRRETIATLGTSREELLSTATILTKVKQASSTSELVPALLGACAVIERNASSETLYAPINTPLSLKDAYMAFTFTFSPSNLGTYKTVIAKL